MKEVEFRAVGCEYRAFIFNIQCRYSVSSYFFVCIDFHKICILPSTHIGVHHFCKCLRI